MVLALPFSAMYAETFHEKSECGFKFFTTVRSPRPSRFDAGLDTKINLGDYGAYQGLGD